MTKRQKAAKKHIRKVAQRKAKRQEATKELAQEIRQTLEHRGSWKLLNHIDTSRKNTQKLLTILPQETVETVLRVYRVTKEFDKIPRYSALSPKPKYPIKDFNAIRKILEEHQIRRTKSMVIPGWLEEKDVDDIMNFICEKFEGYKWTYNGMRTLRAIAKEKTVKAGEGTKSPNIPLKFAAYLLAEHLRNKTGRPNWCLICDFLTEQKIINRKDADIGETELRDLCRKTTENKLRRLYKAYRELYIYPFCNIKNRPHFILQTELAYREITLPDWTKLIP